MNEKHINWSQVLIPNEELYIESGKPLVKVCDKCHKAILKVRSEIE